MAEHTPVAGVALVGRRLEDNDNLGLAYLQAAMDRAALPCVRHTVNGFGDVDAVARSIVERGPSLVGLSLSDGGSAPLLLALGELLRARGYAGHITCGGPFATLARDWLLARYAWLDSVVRHAGEAVLPALASAVMRGEGVAGVAGVTTRAGDGPCAPVLDRGQVDLTPKRDHFSSIGGHRAAHILATRGCEGRCVYCGPASLQQLERKEALLAGFSRSQLDAAGVGGVRRRAVADLCDEMAALWHEHDVRYFYFVDEHLLPYEERAALDYLHALRRGLDERRVGALGIGTMLRADRITPAVVQAFAHAGMVRLFLGIEFGTEQEARRFGRKTSPETALQLFESLDRAGVAVVTNLMLLHPDSTPSSIRAGIELLSRVPSGVFETTRMMVYHGTRLWQRMRDAGRLSGNPLRYGYAFEDPVVERFSHIFTRLRAEAFWDHSVAYRTHDAFLALSLARKLAPDAVPDDVERELEAVRRSVNALYVEAYDAALTVACHGGGALSAGPLVRRAKVRSTELVRRLERCTDRLAARLGTSGRVFSPMRAASVGAISFLMMAAAPSCGGKLVGSESGGAGQDAGTGGAGGTSGSGGASGTGGAIVPCSPDVAEQQRQDVQEAILKNDPCFTGEVWFDSPPPEVSFGLAFGGPATSLCLTPGNDELASAAEASALEAIEGLDVSCLWPKEGAYPTWVQVRGGAQADADTLIDTVQGACGDALWDHVGIAVLIDAEGKAVAVAPSQPSGPPVDPELEACILEALDGLTFPCLAGYSVCPEYVIAE